MTRLGPLRRFSPVCKEESVNGGAGRWGRTGRRVAGRIVAPPRPRNGRSPPRRIAGWEGRDWAGRPGRGWGGSHEPSNPPPRQIRVSVLSPRRPAQGPVPRRRRNVDGTTRRGPVTGRGRTPRVERERVARRRPLHARTFTPLTPVPTASVPSPRISNAPATGFPRLVVHTHPSWPRPRAAPRRAPPPRRSRRLARL